MSIDLTTGCTRDERGHNFNCHKICQWCNRPKDEIELEKLRDQLRWRDAYGESPTEEGIYLVINNDFDGGTSIHATYWKGKWPIGFTVPYWRPIGPLPGKSGE